MTTHKFGGQWTETKLRALGDYLVAYSVALKNQPFALHYIDAFAGAGDYQGKSGETRDGSARIALGIDGFKTYTFVERKRAFVEKLKLLCDQRPERVTTIHHGDTNEHLKDICERMAWKSNRAVLFLDPYGMNVPWSTLELIRKTKAIDVWYLLPLNGILRQMTVDPDRRDESKDQALDRTLGTDTWRSELYKQPHVVDMFAPDKLTREADPEVVCEWLTARLKTLFPLVINVATLRRGTQVSATAGPRLFALYFLMSNDSGPAVGLAQRLVGGVRDKLKRESLVI